MSSLMFIDASIDNTHSLSMKNLSMDAGDMIDSNSNGEARWIPVFSVVVAMVVDGDGDR